MREHGGQVMLPIKGAVASARLFDGGAGVKVATSNGQVTLSGLPALGSARDQIVALTMR